MTVVLLIWISVFQGIGYFRYFSEIVRGQIKPNKWSWLIWSGTIVVETLTYGAVVDDIYKTAAFFVSVVACVIVTIAIWSKSVWEKPTKVEIFSTVASILSILIWIKYDSAVWAHILITIALPIAFVPSFQDAWKDYKKEDIYAWQFWSIGDFIVILLILARKTSNPFDFPYAIIEFACHAVMWTAIAIRRYQHHRKIY